MHGGTSTGPRTPEGLQRIVTARTVHGFDEGPDDGDPLQQFPTPDDACHFVLTSPVATRQAGVASVCNAPGAAPSDDQLRGAALVAENAPLIGRTTPLGQVGSGTQNEPRDALLAHHLVCEPCRVQRLTVVLHPIMPSNRASRARVSSRSARPT